jgi:hypothetical protein
MHPYMIEQIASQRVTEMHQHATQQRIARQPQYASGARRLPRPPAAGPRIQEVLRHALRAV